MSFRSALRRLVWGSVVPADGPTPDAFRSMVEQSADVICHVEDQRFTYVSPSARTVMGWNPEAMIGKDPLSPIYEEDRGEVLESISRIISGQGTVTAVQARTICGDGSLKWCETTARWEQKAAGGYRAVLILRDISDRKRLEEELAAFALQDGLTGLANRRAFDQALDAEWKRTMREGGEMALLILDVDCFKQFNDAYGHQAGDDCLRAVAAAVRKHALRSSDVACRYGGEELAVILGATESSAALEIAESIRSSVSALSIPHERSTCSDYVTVSIGVAAAIARSGGSVRMPESLLQAADHAMYKAKSSGRDRVEQSVLIAPTHC